MEKGRLEAFSDGVLAIIITIMVLELKIPHDNSFNGLKPLVPVFLSYLLSFIYVGIYWNNHHHMLNAVEKISGGTMWANMHLLFWLSLIPFATGWMGENHFAATPIALYGFILLMSAIAYNILQRTLIKIQGKHSVLQKAVGKDLKGLISPGLYLIAIPLAFVNEIISEALYLMVAMMWLIPDGGLRK